MAGATRRRPMQRQQRGRRCGRCGSGRADVVVERRSDGAILMRSPHPLPPYPENLTERLVHWAEGRARIACSSRSAMRPAAGAR